MATRPSPDAQRPGAQSADAQRGDAKRGHPPVAAGFAGARMKRKVFAIAAATIFAAASGLPSVPPVGNSIGTMAQLFPIRAYGTRLQDIDRSG